MMSLTMGGVQVNRWAMASAAGRSFAARADADPPEQSSMVDTVSFSEELEEIDDQATEPLARVDGPGDEVAPSEGAPVETASTPATEAAPVETASTPATEAAPTQGNPGRGNYTDTPLNLSYATTGQDLGQSKGNLSQTMRVYDDQTFDLLDENGNVVGNGTVLGEGERSGVDGLPHRFTAYQYEAGPQHGILERHEDSRFGNDVWGGRGFSTETGEQISSFGSFSYGTDFGAAAQGMALEVGRARGENYDSALASITGRLNGVPAGV